MLSTSARRVTVFIGESRYYHGAMLEESRSVAIPGE